MRLEGKSAIVTGSARGIGKAVAMMFAEQGADVLVNTRNDESLAKIYAEVKEIAQAKVCAFKADVGYENEVNAMFDSAIENFGKVDIIVNNAAIAYSRPFIAYDKPWWDEMLRVNLNSVYFTSNRAVKEMIKRKNKGSIINFSSIGATKSHRQAVAYDTCKGAIETFTRSVALEAAPWDIRLNAISPASILGYYVRKIDNEVALKRDPNDFQTPITRQGTPEDVAYLCTFLGSDESSYITGQVIAIDGGLGIQARPVRDSPLTITPQNLEEKLKEYSIVL